MAIMVMTLPLVVFERVWTPVVARRVCWVVFVAVDVLVLLIILRDAANPAIHLFPKR